MLSSRSRRSTTTSMPSYNEKTGKFFLRLLLSKEQASMQPNIIKLKLSELT
jgi:hypothetical protein